MIRSGLVVALIAFAAPRGARAEQCVIRDARPVLHAFEPSFSVTLPVLDDPRARSIVYRFAYEDAPTRETLRAVLWFDGIRDLSKSAAPEGRAVAVGDRGTVLVRPHRSRWRREQVPTRAHLYAVARAPTPRDAPCGADVPIVAVGADGTAIARGPDGVWRREATGTTRDLHAIHTERSQSYVAGTGNTLLIRSSDGRWSRVRSELAPAPARSDEVQGVSGPIAVGLGGVVRFLSPNGDRTPSARAVVPSRADLHGVSFERDGGFIVGAEGTVLHVAADGLCQPAHLDQLTCAGVGLSLAKPAHAEWNYWLGIGGGVDAEGDPRFSFRIGGAVDFSVARFGDEHAYGGQHEMRSGPWIGAELSESSRLLEGGATLDLGKTYHASWGTAGLRLGAAALRSGRGWQPLATATLTWGVRSVPARYVDGGACVGGCEGLWGIDEGPPPRDHALASGARVFATARTGELERMLLFGLELEPSFLFPPYSLGRLGGTRPD